ncbi:NAD(P)-dependent oxidoreductase [Larkinella punicea]|uniref:NAD(P)-dependent oxidoreductase n=1 Tax=Larkinella punicea TaxID=2315727 RepID=A0A368JTB5_9BACT|nr:NAD(P)-dependent oxidoreductase [Larkinella punicea]RCR70575.1 NAD(P)-dependent oxidoreductase [Larkinella punicea]
MKIALIGATGFVGSALLKEALHRGYDVTAIVRHPEKNTVENPQLTAVKGDVLNEAEVAGLVAGHDAVVSAYNAGWQNPNLYNEYLAGSHAIQNGTKKAGVKRLLVVGGAGSLEIAPGVQLIDTPQFPAEWKPGALAARDYLNTLKKEEDLDWTFISPAILLEPGERTGQFRLGTNQPVFDENGVSKISVEDLAVALLDELDKPAHVRQRFTVGY